MRRTLWIILVLLVGPVVSGQHVASPFRVMTFNIRYANEHDGPNAWSVRNGKVIDEITRIDPDIVGLQEALSSQLELVLERLPAYAHVGVGRDDGERAGEFAPILFRRDRYEPGESGTFWLSSTPGVPGSMSFGNKLPRICTWAVLRDLKSGEELLVANVHLDHRSQVSREKSVALVLDRLEDRADGPVILMGDFNAGEGTPEIESVLADERYSFRNTVRDAGPPAGTIATYTGFRERAEWAERPMIDYVFITHDTLDLRGAGVERRVFEDGRYASDHFPVWADLSFSDPD